MLCILIIEIHAVWLSLTESFYECKSWFWRKTLDKAAVPIDLDQQFNPEMTNNAACNPLLENFDTSSPIINGGFFPKFHTEDTFVVLSPIAKCPSTDQALIGILYIATLCVYT